MRKPKESPSEREQRLRHQPSSRMSQDQSQSYPEKNPTPEQRSESEKFRNRGLNEDEQKKTANYTEDNAQSHRAPSPRNESNSTASESMKRENGHVEDVDDQRLEADDDKDDMN
jgi:hypothetical protein